MNKKQILAAALLLAAISTAHSAQIEVDGNAIEVDANNGVCSLREAILNAEADTQADGNLDCEAGSGADTITLANGAVFDLTDFVDSEGGQNGLPAIYSDITIVGNGATIQRSAQLPCNLDRTTDPGEFRFFFVGGNLRLEGLSLKNGCADSRRGSGNDGGAIHVSFGTLTLYEVEISGNAAWDKSGGIDSDTQSTVLIEYSALSNNRAIGGGGAIGHGGGTMTIRHSTISGNTSGGQGGGGIGNKDLMTIYNSTISGNTTTGYGGGGIGNDFGGMLLIENSTIIGNSAVENGGGIGNFGTTEVRNSIVGNSVSGGDCYSPYDSFTASGSNLDTDGSCAAQDLDFSQVSTAALNVGALADNGGSTRTHALLPDSAAIDAVADCSRRGGGPVPDDQRDAVRPQGEACDIGAYEAPGSASVTFATSIDFSNDDGREVTATLSCNAGLPLEQSYDVSEGSPVVFTMTDLSFASPGTSCEITVPAIDGYVIEASANSGEEAGSCLFEGNGFSLDAMNVCVFTATPAPAAITVNTDFEWVPDDIPESDVDTSFETVITCQDASLTNGSDFGEVQLTVDTDDYEGEWYANPDGGADCSVTLYPDSSAVEGDSCTFSFGVGDEEAGCDVLGTVFFEGVPAIGRRGLALMALMVLGIGFVAVRRII